MANNVNTQLQENPRLQRMPTDQREWHFFVNELAKWVADLDVRGRLTTDRIIPQVILSNAGSVQESLPIVATDAGASVTANISSHTLARQTGDVTYNAGSITGLSYETTYYVYADDADYEGGSVTYLATTDKGDVVGSMGRYFIGEIITPASGEPDRTGSPGAGAGVFNLDIFQTGIKATNTADGIIKTSTSTTVNTGTATDEAITPDALANSDFIMLSDLYGITATETSEGLVEANLNLQYPQGNVLRYGTNTTPGTTDMTDAIQTAIDVVYADGGGTVTIPAGTYGVTALTKEFFTKRINVNIIGDGKSATVLQKIGATTTPIIHFYATGTGPIDVYSTISRIQVSGLSKGHDGIRFTRMAKLDLYDVEIVNCDTGFDNLGTQIFNAYNLALSSNNTGYMSRVENSIYANLVNFYGGQATDNTSFGFDIGSSSGTHLDGVFIYQNGTTTDLTTGSVIIRSTVDDEFGGSIVDLNNCWFEKSDGMALQAEAATSLNLIVRNTELINSESGNVADIDAIKTLTLENVVALSPGDTVTSAATRTLLKGGVIHTYVDNSETITINHASSSGTTVFTGPSIRVDEVYSDERVYVKETAAAGTDLSTWGQLWVSDTTPQELLFTDEAGTDRPLTVTDEVVTATNVITAAESGKTFFLNAIGGFTSTLPAPALGLKYTFIVSQAPTTAYIITTNGGANVMYGTFLDIVGELTYFSAQDTMNFVASTSVAGDRIEMECDGAWWHIKAISGADGGITTSVT